MCLLNLFLRAAFVVATCGVLCGCLPASQGPLDEQNEMHFRKGKALVTALDYKGAIEAFGRALEANPKNASAHFELGLLYERDADYSAAIYHFERFLKLRPQSDYSDIVREKIAADKMELSKTTVLTPITQNMQREFEKLAEENKHLRAELERKQAELEQWRVHYASQSRQPVTPPQPPPNNPGIPQSQPGLGTRPLMRSHTIRAGDTLTSIAGRYGVKLDQLNAVNPGLDPRKLKVGQVIHVPPQ